MIFYNDKMLRLIQSAILQGHRHCQNRFYDNQYIKTDILFKAYNIGFYNLKKLQ